MDKEKVKKGLECCSFLKANTCRECPYWNVYGSSECAQMAKDALELLKEQEKEIKALRLLVEWAEECDFGFDQFPIEYERYKDEIKGMKYTDGMIYIAKRTLEDHGVFEKGR